MKEIDIISRALPARSRSERYASASVVQAGGASGSAQIDFHALFAAEMSNWFVRDVENKGIYPAPVGEDEYGFYTNTYVSAKGKNPDSGSEVSGATTLAALTDVSITTTPKDGQVLAYDITMNKWKPVDMEATAGIDEEELLQILTQKGYATQTWVTQQSYATQQWVTQQSYAKTSVRIKAGTGLTGGGTLAQDVTLSLATVGTAGTYTKVTVDSYGRVTGHASLTQGDIPALAISKITGLQTALDAKLNKSVFEELFEKVWVSGYGYAIRAKLAFYSDDWISAKGLNSDAGSTTGGVDENEVLQIVEDAGYIKSAALSGYATQSWVRGLGYATQSWVNSQGFLTSVGWSDVTEKPSWMSQTVGNNYSPIFWSNGAPVKSTQAFLVDRGAYKDSATGTNWNELLTVGMYFAATEGSLAGETGSPGNYYGYGTLAVLGAGRSAYGGARTQLYFTHGQEAFFRTTYHASSARWASWCKFITDRNIGVYNAGSATKLQTARTIWGQSFDGTGNVSGNMTGVGSIDASSTVNAEGGFYIGGNGVRFFNENSTTTWIQGFRNGVLNITGNSVSSLSTLGIMANEVTMNNKLTVAGTATFNTQSVHNYGILTSMIKINQYLEIGSGRLYWDSTNNALYVQKSDGSTCGFYATGFMSAKGLNSNAGSTTAGATTLNGLSDVTISSPVNGQSLIYRNGVWRNEMVSGGGGSATVAWGDITGKPTWIGSSKPSYSFSEITGTPSVTLSSNSSTNLSINVEGTTKSISSLYATYLGGTTKAGLFTGLSYSSNRLSVTIGGTTKSVTIQAGSSGSYLPLSGGTLTGSVKAPYYYMRYNGLDAGYLGASDYNNVVFWCDGEVILVVQGLERSIRSAFSMTGLVNCGTERARWKTVYSVNSLNTSSDLRLKSILRGIPITVEQVAAAPSFLYRWKNGKDGRAYAGSAAQYWQQVLPEAVLKGEDGYLSMEYDRLALAAVITTARTVVDHETRIRDLEQKMNRLTAE